MSDYKITISRSYTRKINLGNYESADAFANYSEELSADTPQEEIKLKSRELFEMAKEDVLDVINQIRKSNGTLEFDWKKVKNVIDKMRANTLQVGEYEELNEIEADFINSVKKLFKRAEYDNQKVVK